MKSRRHHKILTALKNNEVDSQETLQQLLGQQGIEVNQATLSRDLRALGVVKEPTPDGGFRYRQAMEPQMQSLAYTNLRAFVHDMDWSGNMLVVRTRVGGAQPVGLALDQLSIDGIIGTIAGDDTVLAVLAPNVDGETIANTIWMTIDRKETVA